MNYKEWRALFLKRFSIPKEHSIRRVLGSFTPAEKSVFYFLATVFILSGVTLFAKVNNAYLVEVPIRGGALVEGVVGNPRFINPVLAISEADKNLTTLVYSGLVRTTPEGEIRNDLAEEVTISENGRVYTARIREGASFHDDEPVTADDIIFTVSKIVDPLVKSPRRGNWDGVEVEKVDDRTVALTLKKPYAPFIYNLSVGILPKHIWKNVTDDEFAFSQFNTLPVGSGPYQVERVERNSGGIPDYYRLIPSGEAAESPFIEKLVFKFYPSTESLFEAYVAGDIESFSGLSPDKAPVLERAGGRVLSSPLPRVFAVFFNQSQSPVLLDKGVREALDLASPKERIVAEVLGGYGTVLDGPLPAGLFSYERKERPGPQERLEAARTLLAKSGWKENPETKILEKKQNKNTIGLSFTLSTGDAPELRAVAGELKTSWEELGAKVEILVFESGELNQTVIRPRSFDALLFGEVVGRDADVYPFWHSSQRNDPGLNIALYANGRVDKLLEEARATSDLKLMEKSYQAFEAEIKADRPAVFLYSPSFLYVLPNKVKAVTLGALSAPQDRFLGVRDWYIETDKVWKIFVDS